MGTITSSVGLVSGINTGQIIDELMSIESQPVQLIQTRISSVNAQMQAYNDMETQLSSLQQIGMSLGNVFNPEFQTDSSLSGELLYQLGLVVFLVVGGHHLVISALIDTFQTLPVGYAWVSSGAIEFLSDLVHQSLVLAVQISAPMMGTMAVIGLAMGFLGHTIPQLNVLVVGFPVRTLVGLLVLGLALPAIAEALARIVPGAILQLRQVLMGL